jgi:hypothetical protein
MCGAIDSKRDDKMYAFYKRKLLFSLHLLRTNKLLSYDAREQFPNPPFKLSKKGRSVKLFSHG